MRWYGVRALTAGAALTGTLLAITGPAHAVTGVNVAGGGTVLQIIAGNVPDNITVSVVGGTLHVSNSADTVPAAAPCVAVTANEVACPAAGILRIGAATSNGDDTFINDTALPSRVDMGYGDDTFLGGSATDEVRGRDGNDKLLGRAGNDRLFGNPGDDIVDGQGGNDLANGGTGVDACTAEVTVLCP
ncbi:hypothetical protein GCM10022419_114740 [Nonomuraea rosea]|uniref:Calcium-binding protein n=1 Tax=Nonomuraea rosea TaxID=638574 RepID=A0ABP6ZMD5_9ACTN